MFSWITKIWRIERSRRLSFIFSTLIVIGLILVTVGILARIKVTPYNTYKNKEYGFSIKFPAYWKVDLHPKGGAIVLFIAPRKDAVDPLQANINIAIKDMPEAMTIEYISKIIVNQVTGTFGESIEVMESHPDTLSGKPAYRLTFHGYDPKQKNSILYTTTWTMAGARIFTLTFTGAYNDYPLYKKKVNTMFQSFKLFPPENK